MDIYCLKLTQILCGISFPHNIFINVTDLCAFIYCALVSELNRNNKIVTRVENKAICLMTFD